MGIYDCRLTICRSGGRSAGEFIPEIYSANRGVRNAASADPALQPIRFLSRDAFATRYPLPALRSPLSALRSALCALRSPLSALRSPLCALRSALSALRSALCALRSAILPTKKRAHRECDELKNKSPGDYLLSREVTLRVPSA